MSLWPSVMPGCEWQQVKGSRPGAKTRKPESRQNMRVIIVTGLVKKSLNKLKSKGH